MINHKNPPLYLPMEIPTKLATLNHNEISSDFTAWEYFFFCTIQEPTNRSACVHSCCIPRQQIIIIIIIGFALAVKRQQNERCGWLFNSVEQWSIVYCFLRDSFFLGRYRSQAGQFRYYNNKLRKHSVLLTIQCTVTYFIFRTRLFVLSYLRWVLEFVH